MYERSPKVWNFLICKICLPNFSSVQLKLQHHKDQHKFPPKTTTFLDMLHVRYTLLNLMSILKCSTKMFENNEKLFTTPLPSPFSQIEKALDVATGIATWRDVVIEVCCTCAYKLYRIVCVCVWTILHPNLSSDVGLLFLRHNNA